MNEYRKSSILRYQLVFVFLGFAFCLALVMNVNTGSVDISPFEIFRIIFSGDRSDFVGSSIIWKIRLPRLLSAAVMGGALSVSGFLLQTFFRNPIAGPFVLGISSGAKMFVGFVLLLLIPHTKQVSPYIQVAAAFVGSMLSMGFVMLMSRKVRNMSMLLVAGIMISYICSAVTDLCVTFAKEADIANLTSWSMGSFGSITWDNLKIASIIILFASMTSFFISKPIEAYQLGEGYAQNMGVSIRAFRIVLILCSSLLSACVTAFAGPISFVGIAVPHITKMLLKTAKPIVVIPTTFLWGAVFCMFCDLLARTLFSPVELAISTVTSVFGAPIVVWLMLSREKQV